MHPNTIDLFSDTIARTGHWLDEVMLATGHMEKRHAYMVLRPVLHVLRDRLTVDEAVQLGAQLKVLSHHISAGEVEQVRNQLPVAVRDLRENAA